MISNHPLTQRMQTFPLKKLSKGIALMQSPEEKVVEILQNNMVNVACTLPCDRIKTLIPLIEKNIKTIPLTREENGIGICAGIFLGGGRPVMVIQSTGIGNMINALESLNLTYGIPLPVLVSWRGVYNEPIEAQVEFGRKLPAILDAAGIKYTTVLEEAELDKIDLAIKYSFNNRLPYVVLISPSVWKESELEPPEPPVICTRKSEIDYNKEINEPVMTRYEAIKVLAGVIGDDIIISNLGIPSKELYDISDRELNFYMLGSMGLASAIGVGIAIIQERHVFVIDGDGSILMNPNVLTGIGAYNPENLTIIAIDNAAYGSTGNQETCTCSQVDLELLARSNGIEDTEKVHSESELKEALLRKTGFIHTIVKPVNADCRNIPFSGKEIRSRFMIALED